MNKRIEIKIPIIPEPQKRARSRVIKSKDGKVHSMTYKDADQRSYEESFKAMLYGQLPKDLFLTGPVKLYVTAFMPIPQSYSRGKAISAAKGLLPHITRPDLSNCIKNVEDCLNGVLWRDDRQIITLQAHKRYGALPGWLIEVEYDE